MPYPNNVHKYIWQITNIPIWIFYISRDINNSLFQIENILPLTLNTKRLSQFSLSCSWTIFHLILRLVDSQVYNMWLYLMLVWFFFLINWYLIPTLNQYGRHNFKSERWIFLIALSQHKNKVLEVLSSTGKPLIKQPYNWSNIIWHTLLPSNKEVTVIDYSLFAMQ